MKPFHNKGWPWLGRFESILPQSGAKGKHVYVLALSAPPSFVLDNNVDDDLTEEASVCGKGSGRAAVQGSSMDVDDGDVSVSSSTKWKFSSLTFNSGPISHSSSLGHC